MLTYALGNGASFITFLKYLRCGAGSPTLGEAQLSQMSSFIPMSALGEPSDVAYAMLFLASDEAGYITGQTLVVDGGSTLPESPLFVDDLDRLR